LHIEKFYTGTRTWTDSFKRPEQQKMDVNFGTWIILSLCRVSELKIVTSGLASYNLELMTVK